MTRALSNKSNTERRPTMSNQVLAGLKKISYFSQVPDGDLEQLAETAVKKSYQKNVVIINEGDEAGSLYIILSGKVQAFLSNQTGRMVALSTQESGSFFGELSLLDGEPRSASVMAIEPTVCILIPRHAFRIWLHEHADAAISIIHSLTRRIRMLTESVRGLALTDVYSRLVKVLDGMGAEDGETWIIAPRPSHQELATIVGSSREMVSRIMKDLVRGGFVSVEKKAIRINRKLPNSW